MEHWGQEDDNNGDPPRLWAPNATYPGTAFTRSIGDSSESLKDSQGAGRGSRLQSLACRSCLNVCFRHIVFIGTLGPEFSRLEACLAGYLILARDGNLTHTLGSPDTVSGCNQPLQPKGYSKTQP